MDLTLLETTLRERGEPAYRAGPGVGLGCGRRHRLRRDVEPATRAARGARRSGAVLDADRRDAAGVEGRHDQDALPDGRRPSGRGGADALPRRPPLAVPVVAVGLPADVHVLRDRADGVRPQPDGVGDPRPGAALPPPDAGRPRGVHGHGRADAQLRRGARRGATPARTSGSRIAARRSRPSAGCPG